MSGNRSRIYTRTGDRGETGLAGGDRRDKADPRVEALGAVDELNAQLGLLAAQVGVERGDGETGALLEALQRQLFELGAELASPGAPPRLGPAAVRGLEARIDALEAGLPPLRGFVLPGGSVAAAQAHVARTVCRRAERRLVALAAAEPVGPHALAYLNRLSDLLFVLARVLRHREGLPERPWRPAPGDPAAG